MLYGSTLYRTLIIGVGLACAGASLSFGQAVTGSNSNTVNYTMPDDDQSPLSTDTTMAQAPGPSGVAPQGHQEPQAHPTDDASITSKTVSQAPVPGVVVVPGRYIGPAFAAPATGGETRSYNLNFLAPASALLQPLAGSQSNDPVTPVTSTQTVEAVPQSVTAQPSDPVGTLISSVNTPPGARNVGSDSSQPVSFNFNPPNEPSIMMDQNIPGSVLGSVQQSQPNLKQQSTHLGSTQSAPVRSSAPRSNTPATVAQDIIAIYAASAGGHDRTVELHGGLLATVHTPVILSARPTEASTLHIPILPKAGPVPRPTTARHQSQKSK